MSYRRIKSAALGVLAAGLGSVLFASTAHATFHEWRIDEVYSNASGSVQFIEFLLPAGVDDESHVAGQHISDTAFADNFTIPANLPSVPPPNGHFLVGTPGYAALAGVPAPDYVLPANDFLNNAGDTLAYSFVDSLTFTGSQLPTDGSLSLMRAYGSSTLTTGVNSPTNLAGQTGTIVVPEPTSLALLATAAGFGLVRRRRGENL